MLSHRQETPTPRQNLRNHFINHRGRPRTANPSGDCMGTHQCYPHLPATSTSSAPTAGAAFAVLLSGMPDLLARATPFRGDATNFHAWQWHFFSSTRPGFWPTTPTSLSASSTATLLGRQLYSCMALVGISAFWLSRNHCSLYIAEIIHTLALLNPIQNLFHASRGRLMDDRPRAREKQPLLARRSRPPAAAPGVIGPTQSQTREAAPAASTSTPNHSQQIPGTSHAWLWHSLSNTQLCLSASSAATLLGRHLYTCMVIGQSLYKASATSAGRQPPTPKLKALNRAKLGVQGRPIAPATLAFSLNLGPTCLAAHTRRPSSLWWPGLHPKPATGSHCRP